MLSQNKFNRRTTPEPAEVIKRSGRRPNYFSPEVHTPPPYIAFLTKSYAFRISSIDKWCPFHVPSLIE